MLTFSSYGCNFTDLCGNTKRDEILSRDWLLRKLHPHFMRTDVSIMSRRSCQWFDLGLGELRYIHERHITQGFRQVNGSVLMDTWHLKDGLHKFMNRAIYHLGLYTERCTHNLRSKASDEHVIALLNHFKYAHSWFDHDAIWRTVYAMPM